MAEIKVSKTYCLKMWPKLFTCLGRHGFRGDTGKCFLEGPQKVPCKGLVGTEVLRRVRRGGWGVIDGAAKITKENLKNTKDFSHLANP